MPGHNEDVNEKVQRWRDAPATQDGNGPPMKKRRRPTQRTGPKMPTTMPLAAGQTQLACGGGGGATTDDATRFFQHNPKQFIMDMTTVRQSGVNTITNIGAHVDDQRWKVTVAGTVLPLRIGYAAHIRYGEQHVLHSKIVAIRCARSLRG